MIAVCCFLLAGCSSSRHVPKGSYLLDKVSMEVEDHEGALDEDELMNYVRQLPNHKILWTMKLQLGIYNMSGKDSTKWYNKWLRNMGEAPVVYDGQLTQASAVQLQKALVNKGYLGASVSVDTVVNAAKKKINVNYKLSPGIPHKIKSIELTFPNDTFKELLSNPRLLILNEGDNLDRSLLEEQRERFTRYLRNRGYYAFSKEFVSFNADTTENSHDVDLTVIVNPPYPARPGGVEINSHSPYYIRSVNVITNYDPVKMDDLRNISSPDTVYYGDLAIYCGEKKYLRPSVIDENCFLKVGDPFNARDVDKTYEAFSRLNILKFINISFMPAVEIDGKEWMDAYILLTPGKSQTIALELEGTNSEGDLGVAASVAYSHRNIGSGAETFTLKLRGAYESLSGNLEGFINNRYMEYSVDAGLSFPKFKFPFLKKSFKQRIKATTEFKTSMNYQERPEYTRIIATAGWLYKWTERNNRLRHTVTPIDINYVYLPRSTNDFINQIAPDNPLLRYSYEDHFIMRMGYTFYYTTKRRESAMLRSKQADVSTFRVNAEIAGNLLFAINSILNHRPNFRSDPYKVFGIRYSQYFKVEGDYSFAHSFNHRNVLAFHVGLGVSYPYGNSSILPFEKRFYGGGANGVRGWDVRTLGPGAYDGSNNVSDFINQCGDIRFESSLEYRAKLFWVLELGAFVDIGNIWTIHNYESQPGGMFKFNKFYKQLAASYGLGIRMDFTYFLLRFDLGMKAHNPAANQEEWPLVHPKWGRDSSFHFSIGYPF